MPEEQRQRISLSLSVSKRVVPNPACYSLTTSGFVVPDWMNKDVNQQVAKDRLRQMFCHENPFLFQ